MPLDFEESRLTGWVSRQGSVPGVGVPAFLLGELPDAVLLLDVAGKLQGFNRGAQTLLGLDSAALGLPLDSQVELVDASQQPLRELAQTRPSERIGVRRRGTSEPFRWVRGGCWREAGEDVPGPTWVLLAHTVRLEEMLAERAERQRQFSLLARHAADSVLRLDAQGRFLFVNRTLVQSKFDIPDLIGRDFRELGISPELVRGWEQALKRAQLTRKPVQVESEIVRRDGVRTLAGEVIPEFDGQGNIVSFLVTNWDVTERRKMASSLRFAKFTLDHAGDPVFWVDEQGMVAYANQTALDRFGYTEAELSSLHFSSISPTTSIEAWTQRWERLKRGERLQFETWHRTKAGKLFPVEVVVKLMEHEGKQAACAFIRDITVRKEEEARRAAVLEAERFARERAEEAARAKEVFLAMASHELRTPLAAILLRIQQLRRRRVASGGATDESLAVGLEGAWAVLDGELAKIETSARLQGRLIEDLLDVAAMHSGKLSLNFERLALEDVLQSALEEAWPMAENKGVTLGLGPVRTPGWVKGDRARLRQVVLNLLSNAVKFTPPGGSVWLRMWEEPHGEPSRVCLEVKDTGQGISRAFLPHVFELFLQEEQGSRRSHGGIGLGLAISRALMERHGGIVRAASAGEGQGATFTLELPVWGSEVAHPDSASALSPPTEFPNSGP